MSSDSLLKEKPFGINKQELIESLRTNPTAPRAWLILGWMMAEDNNPERARECYERALKINLLLYGNRAWEWGKKLPNWVNSVVPETLMSSDLYDSEENIDITLPSWFDESDSSSLDFRYLLTQPLVMMPLLVFFGPLCIVLTRVIAGEGEVDAFLQTLLVLMMGLLALKQGFETLKVIKTLVSSDRWPAPEAIIVGSFVRRWKNKNKNHHDLYVVCAYQADDNIYYSTVPSKDAYGATFPLLGSETYKSWGNFRDSYLEDKEREFGFPSRIRVYHDPRNPETVLHRKGVHYDGLALLTGMIILLSSLGFFSYMFWIIK